MKKILLGMLATLAAALLITPKFVGGGIQSAAADTLRAMVPPNLRDSLTIESTELQHGWFTSHARLQVSLEALDRISPKPVVLNLDLDIRHGPLLFTPVGVRVGAAFARIVPSLQGFDLPGPEASIELAGSDPLLTLFAGFDNSMELGLDADRFTAGYRDSRLAAEGLRARSQIFADLSNRAQASIDAVTTVGPGLDLAMENLTATGWRSDITRTLSASEAGVSVSSLVSSAPLAMDLDSLQIDYRLSDNENSPADLDMNQQVRVAHIDWDLPVDSLDWQLQISQLNRKLLNSYSELIRQASTPADLNLDQASATLTGLGREFLVRLAREPFDLHSSLQLGAYNGGHDLQLSINWQGLPYLTDIEAFEPGAALNALVVSVNLDADEAALMNSPFAQTVTDYRALLEIAGGRVRARITMGDGQLTLNDETFPLRQFVNF
ncbi:MAG: DUF945 family protein [Gammaproteobacteria bacterium]|nr:DUF945 family protein [Pseudomonadales bacterium]MCP5346460.1 DUF945 family protein [Pseudomonadales bacterium]